MECLEGCLQKSLRCWRRSGCCEVSLGSELARELEVKRTKLYEWAAELERYGDEAFPGAGRRPGNQPRVERGREDEARLAGSRRERPHAQLGTGHLH